ncbi:restriction endonuclease subunit S [Methanoculleus oceani]|uniref:Restriction endonuclease n=1 Tax=Methanoculleus oceani TaxID=2184756 RepID=A0ABD4THT5_9EURY|nr:restriction endonuclease subunit S [Methanoculleus sp. CWC-02]MCM2466489.1 restriction endonuclease [Methanoculleus sp. CWC-02]
MSSSEMEQFLFSDIFTCSRGKRLIEEDQIAGDIAYISSTKYNNGISGYITPPDVMTHYENKITLSNSGSVGYAFYHDYEFVASDHVTVIGIKEPSVFLTREIALYLKPVFEFMRYKYNFGREISDERLKKERVLLPIDAQGNPDWTLMQTYIGSLSRSIKWDSIQCVRKEPKLYVSDWHLFRMDEIFDFYKGKRLTKENMTPGDTNFIGAISTDNGIRQRIDEDPLYLGNCITVNYNGSVGEAFYQKDPFWASDDVNVLCLKRDLAELNVYLAMFLITIIKQNKHAFDFGRKWNLPKMKSTLIGLPVAPDGTPDWAFMEEYIKSLAYSDKL